MGRTPGHSILAAVRARDMLGQPGEDEMARRQWRLISAMTAHDTCA